MAKPKLLLIPAAQGDKFYSVLPSSGVGDFDFTRSGGATRINSQGLIETVGDGVSRLNYPLIDGKVVGCPSHLLEPQSTNSIAYSNFQSGWSLLSGGSITQNQSISPDGTQNAAILSGNGVGANAAYTFINITAQEYTYSMFAKKGSEYILRMIGFSSGANGNVEFNLNNGTIETPSDGTFSNEKIEDYGNGWYRCIVKVTATSSGSKTFGFNREAIVSGNLFSVYGAQFEASSYPTSYIKSNGSQTTRSAETANGSGDAATFNDSEGVLFAEVSKDKGTQYSLISLQKSSVSDTYAYIGYLNNNTTIRGQIKVGGTIVLDEEIEMSDTSIVAKILIKYKSGDYSMWVNGF